MAISKADDVFTLVKSLTKAEKRTFRLFAERIHDSGNLLYMQLFDLMEKQKVMDEQLLRQKLGITTQSKYSNTKRHLYSQLLISLRLIDKSKKPSIQVREQIDFAYILYGKGLYMQSLKILEKARKLATKHHDDFALITIGEVLKMIHSRHITRAQSEPIRKLLKTSSDRAVTIVNRVKLSNLRLVMHKFYIEKGHVKNEEEEKYVVSFLEENMPTFIDSDLGLMEKVHLYQAYVWYYYILNDFENCFVYAEKWVKLFKQNSELQVQDINLYFRGYHYLLTSAFNLKDSEKLNRLTQELELFRKSNYNKFNDNTKITSFLYVHSARLNEHFLNHTFEVGVKEIGRTLSRLERYRSKLDEHKVMVMYYKIAWMYLGNKQPEKSVKFLHSIIQMTNISLRQDIQVYARLMFLMVHFDLGNIGILPSLIKNYKSFFKRNELNNKVQVHIIKFFKEISNTPLLDIKNVIRKHLEILMLLESSKFEKRAFLYLDITYWLRSKL